ncbi:MAG: biopolymer transporter ExbD [Candidatus Latescibacterota bacterium]|nr:MAG: biopolymer transporter ExbD [Candidatus Latescibacterota bacterium]
MIETTNEIANQWASFFGVAVLQNTIFLVVVFFALHLFRNAPARVKYLIAAAGIIKLLIPPFIPSSLIGASPAVLPSVPYLTSNIIFTSTPATGAPVPSTASGLDALGFLFLAWVGAAAFYLTVVAYRSWHLARSLRAADEISADEITGELGGPSIRILRSSNIALPITTGLFPHRIYVPDTWSQWPKTCRIAAVRHELAHIRRHDGLFAIAEILVRALYFFHPLVWVLSRRLDQYREMACDDAATNTARHSRLQYSRNLVEIAETVTRDTLTCESASALLRRKNELMIRIKYQMKEGVMRHVSKKTTAIVLAALTLLVLPLSWYQTGAAPGTKTSSEQKVPEGMQAIDVSVHSADKIAVDGSTVSLDSFDAALGDVVGGDPDKCVINLICANDVPMGVVFDVQRILQSRNLLKVSYNSDLPETMPLVLPSKQLEDKIKSIPDQDIAIVSVAGSGTMMFQNVEVSIEDLTGRVNKSIKENQRLIVSIEMERSATYGDFVKALRAVKDGDAQRILVNSPVK